MRIEPIKRGEGSACARRETQSHENLTFCENLKKSKNYFLVIFVIFVIFEFFFVIFSTFFEFLSFLSFLLFYVFKLLFKHFWTPGKLETNRKIRLFRFFVPKNLKNS